MTANQDVPTTSGNGKPSSNALAVGARILFYLAAVIGSLLVFQNLLLPFFGPVVAGTLGLFSAGILGNTLTLRIFDRRVLADIGLKTVHGSARNFFIGLALGAGAAIFVLAAPLLAGTGHLTTRPGASFSWATLIFYLVALIFGAAGEELMFRGYAFQLLIQHIGPFATVLPVSVLFGFVHLFNPNSSHLGVLNTVLWGFLFGFAFLRSHDLWLPIGLHYGWNAVLPLFGVNLSGLTIDVTRYVYQWDLSPTWSGGAYGPEGGLLTTIVSVILFVALLRVPLVPQQAVIAPVLNDSVF